MKKAATVSDIELSYRPTPFPSVKIVSSAESAKLARSLFPIGQIALRECFGVLLLNRSSRVLHSSIIATGGQSAVLVDTKLVLQYALLANAAAIVAFHNHPSGSVKPSSQDVMLTKKLYDCCRLFDISLIDHIILAGYDDATPEYYSFADNGLV